MPPLIPDTSADGRLAGLERFIERYFGPRRPEFGTPEDELRAVQLPDPLRRFLRFAGRWPGENAASRFENCFCVQDVLCAIHPKDRAPQFELMDDRLVFVVENQGVWVAATLPSGVDPPVWITEQCSHREPERIWRRLERPLSHFLVSYALQEAMFGSAIVATAPAALEKFRDSGATIETIWIDGEYAWDIDRPSYFFAADRMLIRRAPTAADGDDWYASNDPAAARQLTALGLPTLLG